MEPSVESILKKLQSLSRQDRRWVIERLPDSAKSALLSGPRQHKEESGVRVADSGVPLVPLAAYQPIAVAQLLANEPGWLIELLLREGEPLWRKRVLLHLPAATRSSVTALLQTPVRVSKPVLDSLYKSVRRKLDTVSSIQPVVNVRPRWHGWSVLQALRARVRL